MISILGNSAVESSVAVSVTVFLYYDSGTSDQTFEDGWSWLRSTRFSCLKPFLTIGRKKRLNTTDNLGIPQLVFFPAFHR